MVTAKVDAVSGMKPGKHTTKTKSEVFARWQVPTQEDDMHKEVKICKPSGLIANASCKAAGLAVTKVYAVLYDPYTKQFQPGFKQCKPCPPTKTDTKVYTPKADTLTIVITTPDDHQTVGSDFTLSSPISAPNPITGIEFYLDGVLQFTDASKPYSTQFASGSIGDHEIMVQAYDDSGDSKDETIDVTVPGGTPLIHSPP